MLVDLRICGRREISGSTPEMTENYKRAGKA